MADPASEKLHFRYQIRRSGAPFADDSVALHATKPLAGCARISWLSQAEIRFSILGDKFLPLLHERKRRPDVFLKLDWYVSAPGRRHIGRSNQPYNILRHARESG